MVNLTRNKHILVATLLAVCLTLLVLGCGGSAGPDSLVAQDQVYTIADATGDYGFPSPFAHYSRGPGYIRMSMIFDTLLWKDADGYVPALAAKWDYLASENAYLFHLNNTATWHDGKKVTVDDVLFTFDYLKKFPYQTTNISMIKTVEAIDSSTVKITLSHPHAPFLDQVAGTIPILPRHIWQNITNPAQFRQPEALIGSGPFKLVDYNKEQGSYLYEAYEGYYQGNPKFKQLKFIKMNVEMATAALKQHQIDITQIPPELVKPLEQTGLKILTMPHDWIAKLVINHQQEPFNSTEFRQALAYAIDRKALIDTTLRGQALPGNPGLIPPDSQWYNPALAEMYLYSPDSAGKLLAKLGYNKSGSYWEKNGQPLEIELLVTAKAGIPGSPGERQGEFIKVQLEQFGIKVNLKALEGKTLDNRINEGEFELALNGHGGLGADPDFLTNMIVGKGFNSAHYHQNQTLTTLLAKQASLMDNAARKQLFAEIQTVFAADVPALALYYPTWYYAYSNRANLYFTKQGIGSGAPIPLNKMSFVK
ncbi:ABC transporter substrate-binding protein [Sporomusa sp. KB1]|jgi:peptide/nickel transport system substrate-binding protein|uniref:ABC transporter substrate-binding protein n=1 Tax=Sporomusa sp. KB1 TaxID=943346 RepID=UPI00119D9F09|nr:ABC transporter substrate-binding protein [Sporomusa sp. KB1]TWH51636.1 peptide/nickel transport system substrate-binding protein [Sporomusa sp. KB1]TWH52215.1 peptide/nickel transport system substrate-binding protein [Sporomusa sp. KB1]